MTVGVAGAVWGRYHPHVRRWYDSLTAAGTDEIVLVTDRPRPDIPCHQIIDPPHAAYREASWWTAGVNALSTDYRATLGVDDQLLHDCWAGITGDVWLLGFQYGPLTVLPPYDTAHDYLMHEAAIVGHASPFKAEWFIEYPQVAYSDWKVYLDMARRGAVFVNARKAGFIHYDTPDSLSLRYKPDHDRHRREALA